MTNYVEHLFMYYLPFVDLFQWHVCANHLSIFYQVTCLLIAVRAIYIF